MRNACLAVVAMTLAASCSVQEPPVKAIYAEDMPVFFAYGSLAGRTPEYQQITNPRTGAVVQRMMVDGGGEWAIIDFNAVSGDYAYRTQDPRTIVQSMFKPGVAVEWGDQGNLHGTRAVNWRRVALTDPAASAWHWSAACASMSRAASAAACRRSPRGSTAGPARGRYRRRRYRGSRRRCRCGRSTGSCFRQGHRNAWADQPR
jgi:hypothetical protein